jgi:hypothetical protein
MMSLQAAALGFWRRSNLRISEGIASGEEQERPRKDMVGRRVRETIFLRILSLANFKILFLFILVLQ